MNTITNTMKAIQFDSPGGAEVLQLREVERRKPKAGEVLVRMKAIGVNYMDVGLRKGTYNYKGGPTIPGGEGAGIVEELGEGVLGFSVGERVAYAGAGSSYAEFVVVPADRLIHLPSQISFEDGAAFPLQGMTAHYLIHDFYHVHAGTTILIHAVAGGVGLLLTQMAAHMSAFVIGTTSTEEKASSAREAGANEIILYTKQNFVEEVKRITNGVGVDLILDSVGKTTFSGDLEAVRIRGTVVVFGASSGAADPIVPNSLMPRSITLAGGSLPNFIKTREELDGRSSDVMNGIKEGWLKLKIDEVLPLAKAAEAHRKLESRQTSGKLVLVP